MSSENNQKLFDAIFEDPIFSFEKIDELLRNGADPIGYYEDNETVLADLFYSAAYEVQLANGEKHQLHEFFPRLISLFINNGMDCSLIAPSEPVLDEMGIMWYFDFGRTPEHIETLKIMIENGLPAEAVEDYLDHFYYDVAFIDMGCISEVVQDSDDPNIEEKCMEEIVNGLRCVMLLASYPHILENSSILPEIVDLDTTNENNSYNLMNFRKYQNFRYEFDLSTCTNAPHGFGGTVVNIRENGSDQIVWKMQL